MFLLSIDVGTSGVRAALFDERGAETHSTQSRRRAEGALSDLGEFDPEALVHEVISTVDELFTLASPANGSVAFIAISTFWHSLVGVDRDGRPTTPLLTWADTRAAQDAKDLRVAFDEREIHARTGCRFHASYWPAKLRWLRRHWPDRFAATQQWLGFGESLCVRLFGETAAGVSLASATGLFNQQTCGWDTDFIRALDISPDTLPEINNNKPRLIDRFAQRWPALAEARLAVVAGDGATNNIGAGCSTKDRVALMIGTSGAMRVVYKGGPPDQLPSALWSYRANRDRVAVGGALSDGGGLFRWLTESLNLTDRTDLELQLGALEPDAHGLTILPFWSGERSTGWSPDARAVILGLRQETRPVEIVRAALEAIAYRFALIARALNTIAPEATVIASGNALRSSPVWIQILADVLGRPIALGEAAEASIRGAALLALEAVGKIATVEEVSVSTVAVFQPGVFQPDMARHARYREGLARQEELYDRLFS
ncbi:MAG TPA: gluconokinase [Pyrinomonadaceae bacterium]|nr:gluconokinase [Pyrinomonadaceae bacterium]